MIPTEDIQKIFNWIEQQLGKHYKDFHVDYDPKEKKARLKIVCRICNYPAMCEKCWAYPLWDKKLAEGLRNIAYYHLSTHQRKIIKPS